MFTDETVPVTCPECEATTTGYKGTLQHLLLDHADLYNAKEAHDAALIWVEQSHADVEADQEGYEKWARTEQAIERAIDATIEYSKESKVEMDGDFKEYDKQLHIKHIERMDRGEK